VSRPKKIPLTINLYPSGRHNAAWKTLAEPASLSTDIDALLRIAATAERGLFDGLFVADNYAGLAEDTFTRPFRALAPGVMLAALATHTHHLGLVLTAPALYGNPATQAREVASLDHVSKGRAAWNIITSQEPQALAILGPGNELPRSAKYDKADEYVTVVTQLWESLPASAIVADAATSTYVDAERLRPIDFQGNYYQVAGVLGVLGGYQGRRPVLFQAGASESSKQFGSRWADALYTSLRVKSSAQKFYRDVKQYTARKWRRDPQRLLVVPGVYPFLGATEAEARQRKSDLDDQLDFERPKASLAALLGIDAADLDLGRELPYGKIPSPGPRDPAGVTRAGIVEDARRRGVTTRQLLLGFITGGNRGIVGTPEQVADDLIDWIDTDACDGFNLVVDRFHDGLDHLADWLVPELQARGRFRKEYESTTFRGNLGLDDGSDGSRSLSHRRQRLGLGGRAAVQAAVAARFRADGLFRGHLPAVAAVQRSAAQPACPGPGAA
jgi:FMN-dependent oxidoreductase (nitrilotriacetate monooxygenase family)